MFGHNVRVVRDGAETVEGVLQRQDETGVTITIHAYKERAQNVFVPWTRVLEIRDMGRVWR